MKAVCICGSFRFYEEMVQLRHTLPARGVRCEWPLRGPRQAPQTMTADAARDAIIQHLERLDRAECILVCNKDGSLGHSVVIESGYADAQRKPVYVLAPMDEPCLRPLVRAVVSLAELRHVVPP
jgi:hypothetical protein